MILVLGYFLKNIFLLYKNRNINKLNTKYYNFSLILNIGFFSYLFPLMPTGNFFSHWLSVAYYLPVGFLLYSIDLSNKHNAK